MRNCKSLLLLIFILPFCSKAQKDSVVELKSVSVESFRTSAELPGLKSTSPDSICRTLSSFNSLDAILTRENIYLKNYGPSQLATVSWRGGSSYHAGIIWNGMNIIDPMTGTSDFSLFRNFLFDNIRIQYGGSTAMTGSGNLSGSLLVDNRQAFNSGLSLHTGSSYGSTGNFTQLLGLSFGTKRSYTSVHAFTENALNKYNYFEGPEVKVQNKAQSVQRGFTFNQSVLTGSKSILDLLVWYQYADRSISPSLYIQYNGEQQKDENLRAAISWKKSGSLSYKVRAAFFNSILAYADLYNSYPSAHTITALSEAEMSYRFSESHTGGIMGNYSLINADTKDYGEVKDLTRKWINGYYDFRSLNRKWKGTISVRQEFFGLFNSSPTFTSGITRTSSKATFRFSASTLHRNPTLNDLYWRPGGNPSLQPEKGYSFEAGILLNADRFFSRKNTNSTYSLDLNFYSRRIKNWIQWIPDGMIWKPFNLDEVWSRGMETEIRHSTDLGKIRIASSVNFAYTLSTKEKSTFAGDQSLYKQLIYVPLYSGCANLTIGYNQITLRFEENYNGYRYTATDNSTYLSPSNITNLHLLANLKFAECKFQVSASVENLLNKNYALLQNRPQPLRWYRMSVLMNLSRIN